MAQFDFPYYRDVFRGELNEADFMKYAPVARDVVELLSGRKLCDEETPHVLRALCFQTDASARGEAGVIRESVGDYSVSYGDTGCERVCGVPVSSLAIAALSACGILTRWV